MEHTVQPDSPFLDLDLSDYEEDEDDLHDEDDFDEDDVFAHDSFDTPDDSEPSDIMDDDGDDEEML